MTSVVHVETTYTDAGNVWVGGKAASLKAPDSLGARVIAEVMLARELDVAVFAVLSGDVRTHGKNISRLSSRRGQCSWSRDLTPDGQRPPAKRLL